MQWQGRGLLDVDVFSKSDPFLKFLKLRDEGDKGNP
jgi:hypothetical protein